MKTFKVIGEVTFSMINGRKDNSGNYVHLEVEPLVFIDGDNFTRTIELTSKRSIKVYNCTSHLYNDAKLKVGSYVVLDVEERLKDTTTYEVDGVTKTHSEDRLEVNSIGLVSETLIFNLELSGLDAKYVTFLEKKIAKLQLQNSMR